MDSGISPIPSIYAATRATINLIDRTAFFETIEAGKLADTIAVDESSLDDISILESVFIVINDGVVEYRWQQ